MNPSHVLRSVSIARHRLGMTRLELGALLETVREHRLWDLQHYSFSAYLESLCINDSSAYQWMRIARKFLVEIKVSDAELQQLALVNMTTLDLASRVITLSNRDEIIGAITVLHKRDAKELLLRMQEPQACDEMINPRVRSIMNAIHELPDDLRLSVFHEMRCASHGASQSLSRVKVT